MAGQFRLDGPATGDVRAVELSVLWHTEGKGDEDMSVHLFERVESDEDQILDFRQPRRFSTVLPGSPLSYDGLIVKIRWCVRPGCSCRTARSCCSTSPFSSAPCRGPRRFRHDHVAPPC